MIFRRIKAHIQNENWFAVFVDFIIVVVGVFIGLQVSNWNDARITHARGADFTKRLIVDVNREQENVQNIYDYLKDVRSEALKAHDSLTGRERLSDEALLGAIFRATQFMWYTRERSTYDEIIAAGALELIEDRKLRKLAVQYFNSQTLDRLRNDGKQLQYTRVIHELIPPRILQALIESCGDKILKSAYGEFPLFSLAYPCQFTSLKANALRSLVSEIESRPEIIPLLRQRIANIVGLLADIKSEFFSTNLDDSTKAEAQ